MPGCRGKRVGLIIGAVSAAPIRALILLALLLAVPLPALAIEKCVSPQGKVTYSEAPCPAGSKSSTVRGSDAPSGGGAAAPAMGPRPARQCTRLFSIR